MASEVLWGRAWTFFVLETLVYCIDGVHKWQENSKEISQKSHFGLRKKWKGDVLLLNFLVEKMPDFAGEIFGSTSYRLPGTVPPVVDARTPLLRGISQTLSYKSSLRSAFT